MTQIFFTGCNYTDLTVTFSIGTARWEYWLPTEGRLNAVCYIAKRSEAKALAHAKRYAKRALRLQ